MECSDDAQRQRGRESGLNSTHRNFWRVGTLLFGVLGILSCAGCGKKASSDTPAHPPEVEVASVVQEDVPIYSEWVGTLDGYVNAQIQPQVTGISSSRTIAKAPSFIKGMCYLRLIPARSKPLLDQAKAQLAQAEAQLGAATLNVKRDIPEAQAQAIPQSQLDNDTQAKLAAEAAVQAAQAAVEQAQLNLGYTKVRSLIDGIAGIAQVQVGNLVTALDRAYVPFHRLIRSKPISQSAESSICGLPTGLPRHGINLLSSANPISACSSSWRTARPTVIGGEFFCQSTDGLANRNHPDCRRLPESRQSSSGRGKPAVSAL